MLNESSYKISNIKCFKQLLVVGKFKDQFRLKIIVVRQKRTYLKYRFIFTYLLKNHVQKPCKPVFLYHYSHCCRVELLKVKLN